MEWISVKKELPKEGQVVIIWNKENSMRKLTVWDDGDEFDATYWMPVPDPPKQPKEPNEAINFAEWLEINMYRMVSPGLWLCNKYPFPVPNFPEYINSEDLYKLYKCSMSNYS